jgi:hypothetical protein
LLVLESSIAVPRASIAVLRASIAVPRASIAVPRASIISYNPMWSRINGRTLQPERTDCVRTCNLKPLTLLGGNKVLKAHLALGQSGQNLGGV